MPIQGTAINYWDRYAFIVKIDGVVRAAFNKCSGLKAEAEVIEYSEGGALTPHKQPGTIKFDDIELERETYQNEGGPPPFYQPYGGSTTCKEDS